MEESKANKGEYLSKVMKISHKLPSDVIRTLLEKQKGKLSNSSTRNNKQEKWCSRCFTPFMITGDVTYSLAPCSRSTRDLRYIKSRQKSTLSHLSAAEKEKLESHNQLANISIAECLVCGQKKRVLCPLPEGDRQILLEKRQVAEKLRKLARAKAMKERRTKSKIFVPEIPIVKKTKAVKRKVEVDCGLQISPALKMELQQNNHVLNNSSDSISSIQKGRKKKKKTTNGNNDNGSDSKSSAVVVSNVSSSSSSVIYDKNNKSDNSYKSTGKQKSVSASSNIKRNESAKLALPTLQVGHNIMKKQLSSVTANVLKNALKKTAPPKQSSLKNFLESIF